MLTLPLWLFALVWLAAWAFAWFVLARVWPARGVDVARAARSGYGWVTERVTTSRGVRPWASLIATALAFAADLVATVLA